MQCDTVSISFDNLVAEHVAADRLYYKSTFWAKADKIVAGPLVLAGILLICTAGLQWWVPIPFALAILEWFNLLSPRPLVIRYWFRKNPKFSETYHLTFGETGMHFLTNTIDARISWEQYTNVLEDARLWLLVYGHRMYSVIPKRAFKDNDEVECFKALITGHIVSRG
jgi:hypothetical protein